MTLAAIMVCSSSTDDGLPIKCDICGQSSHVNLSNPPGDSICPCCGSFLWVSAFVERTRECSFVPDLQIAQLKSTTRNESLVEIANQMGARLQWSPEQNTRFSDAVIRREEIGATGVYPRVAVPHARIDWIDRCYTAVALAPHGIDFQSGYGQKVHTIILIAAPKVNQHSYLQCLQNVARSMHVIAGSKR
jgi:mannitol/fructose-specific phosphotransferase system IIA component (Ntr-type)